MNALSGFVTAEGSLVAEKPQIIRSRGDLVKRAVNFKKGMDTEISPEVVSRINAAIDGIKVEARTEILARLQELRNVCQDATSDPVYLGIFQELIKEVAFDVKGMAGTIGFPLMTEIADSLHRFISNISPNSAQHLDLIRLHIDALYILLTHGENARAGTERMMTDGLKKASTKVARESQT